MVSWWWIPASLWIGALAGGCVMALFDAAHMEDYERDHFRDDTKKEGEDNE